MLTGAKVAGATPPQPTMRPVLAAHSWRSLAGVAVEVVVAVAVLVWATNPRLGALPADDEAVRAGWWAAYGLVAVVAAPRWRTLLATVRHEPALIGLVVVASLSIGWTTLPGFTGPGSGHLAGTVLIGAWLAARFTPVALAALVGTAVAIGAGVSLALVAGDVPWAVGTTGYDAGWTGVWPHRNQAGIRATLGFVACGAAAAAALSRTGWSWPWRRAAAGVAGAGALACGVLAVGSRSATPYVVLLVLAICVVAAAARATYVHGRARAERGRGARGASMVLSAATTGLAALVVVELPATLELLDRRPDFTGRTELWAAVWEAAGEQFALGHGYNGFWAGMRGPSAPLWQAFNGLPHSHNGYLDVVLELGVVGLGLLVVVLIALALRLGTAVWRRPAVATVTPAVLASVVVLHAWSSSPLFAGRNVFTIVLAALAFRMAADSAAARAAARAPARSRSRPPGEPVGDPVMVAGGDVR